jgi:hypothetical protein
MAKVTLSFEMTGTEEEFYAIQEAIIGILEKEIDIIDYHFSDIKIIEMETDYEEEDEE